MSTNPTPHRTAIETHTPHHTLLSTVKPLYTHVTFIKGCLMHQKSLNSMKASTSCEV